MYCKCNPINRIDAYGWQSEERFSGGTIYTGEDLIDDIHRIQEEEKRRKRQEIRRTIAYMNIMSAIEFIMTIEDFQDEAMELLGMFVENKIEIKNTRKWQGYYSQIKDKIYVCTDFAHPGWGVTGNEDQFIDPDTRSVKSLRQILWIAGTLIHELQHRRQCFFEILVGKILGFFTFHQRNRHRISDEFAIRRY